jgi:WASH complex subunit strumpellin
MATLNFLAEGNVAGQTLLRLVSRGSALLAELLRLSKHIPEVFYLSNRDDQAKYGEILTDFRYWKAQEGFDQRIQSNTVLGCFHRVF